MQMNNSLSSYRALQTSTKKKLFTSEPLISFKYVACVIRVFEVGRQMIRIAFWSFQIALASNNYAWNLFWETLLATMFTTTLETKVLLVLLLNNPPETKILQSKLRVYK